MKTKIIVILTIVAGLLGGWMLQCRCHKEQAEPPKPAIVNARHEARPQKEIVISTAVTDAAEDIPGVLYTPGTIESRTLQDIPLHLNVYSQSFGSYTLAPNEILVDLDRAVAENIASADGSHKIPVISADNEIKSLQIIKILHSANDKYYGVVRNDTELNVLGESYLSPHSV